MWVYGLLTGLVIVLGVLRAVWYFYASCTASTRIHDAMAARLLRAPLSFFHTNPVGRVLNRFALGDRTFLRAAAADAASTVTSRNAAVGGPAEQRKGTEGREGPCRRASVGRPPARPLHAQVQPGPGRRG